MALPFFPMYPADFEADTSHLTLEEDGAYNRLLRLCWMMPGCSLPDDPAWIARRMRVDMATYERVVAPLLVEFFRKARKRVFSPRLSREFARAEVTHELRVSAGKKGGRPTKALKNNVPEESRGKAGPKQPEPHPYKKEDGGGGSAPTHASAREASADPPPVEPGSTPPEPTFRERLLVACGVDPVSGMTGRGGQMIGRKADMAVAAKWTAPMPDGLGLTEDDCVAVIAEERTRMRDPPGGFRYFDGPMARLAAARAAPPPAITEPVNGASHAPRQSPRAAAGDAIHRLADDLAAGRARFEFGGRDPFAAG